MILANLFERIYVVNLRERTDRRIEMTHELARCGISSHDARLRFFPAVRPADAGLFPSIGARGCFMSHLGILREALRDRLANVLVMEDDLAIDPRFAEPQLEMAGALARRDWHFAYFGHVESLPPGDGAPAWVDSHQPMACTHFYALNRSALEPLEAHLTACLERAPGHPLGSPMHVDGAYSLFRMHNPGVITLMASPSLGGQRSSRSDVHPNKWYDRTPLLRQLAGLARDHKNQRSRARTIQAHRHV